MRIALQPAGLSKASVNQHFQDTIETQVPFAAHRDLLSPDVHKELRKRFPRGKAQFWGATPGTSGTTVGKWAKLRPGDGVLFYGDHHLYLAGHVALTFRNESLAERLWQRTDNGLTWELMFALTDLRNIKVPITEVRAVLGWQDRAVVQGFTVIDGDRAERLADLVDLDDMLNLPATSPGPADTTPSGTTTPPAGPTDETRSTTGRREHRALKRHLVRIGGGVCGLCGSTLPPDFLIAAHIKKRSFCSEDERKDFDNVGMLACFLGCDSLFEHGYVAVDTGGDILISNAVDNAPDVAKFIAEHLQGRTTTWWNTDREPYYAWHRNHVFKKLQRGK